ARKLSRLAARVLIALTVFVSSPLFAQFADPVVAPGGLVLDDQTGYYLQVVRVTNPGATAYPGIRTLVRDLPADVETNIVRIANAQGFTNTIPFFDFGPLAAGASVDLVVEIYIA